MWRRQGVVHADSLEDPTLKPENAYTGAVCLQLALRSAELTPALAETTQWLARPTPRTCPSATLPPTNSSTQVASSLALISLQRFCADVTCRRERSSCLHARVAV
eukprot:1391947-Rhodomonas_salina.1